MRKPTKPGSEDSKSQDKGALGNIDEERGHPGKGTGGASIKPEETGDRKAGKDGRGNG